MLNVIQQAIVGHLDALRGPGQALEGVKLVQFGDAPVPSQYLPAVTVDWDGKIPVKPGDRVELSADFAVTLYACSFESQGRADAVVQDLLIRAAAPAWLGLIPVLAKMQGCTDDAGRSYLLQLQADVQTGGVKAGQVYASAAVLTMRVTTWVDRREF